MKGTLLAVCLLSLAGCASSPDASFSHATPGCKAATATVDGKPVATQFCIKAITFKPSQYLVTVNDQTLFSGTDYQRVAFEKSIREGQAKGGCNELIELRDSDLKPIARNELPAELVAGCRISADANGRAQAFSKDAACDQAFYKSLAPLLGKVIPTEVARQCTVTLGEQTVFDQRFDF